MVTSLNLGCVTRVLLAVVAAYGFFSIVIGILLIYIHFGLMKFIAGLAGNLTLFIANYIYFDYRRHLFIEA